MLLIISQLFIYDNFKKKFSVYILDELISMMHFSDSVEKQNLCLTLWGYKIFHYSVSLWLYYSYDWQTHCIEQQHVSLLQINPELSVFFDFFGSAWSLFLSLTEEPKKTFDFYCASLQITILCSNIERFLSVLPEWSWIRALQRRERGQRKGWRWLEGRISVFLCNFLPVLNSNLYVVEEHGTFTVRTRSLKTSLKLYLLICLLP